MVELFVVLMENNIGSISSSQYSRDSSSERSFSKRLKVNLRYRFKSELIECMILENKHFTPDNILLIERQVHILKLHFKYRKSSIKALGSIDLNLFLNY